MEEVDFYCLEAKCDDRELASRRTNPRRYPSEENVQDFIPMFPAVLHTYWYEQHIALRGG